MLNAEVSETRSGVSGGSSGTKAKCRAVYSRFCEAAESLCKRQQHCDNMRAGDSMHDYGNVQKRIALA